MENIYYIDDKICSADSKKRNALPSKSNLSLKK